MKQHENSVKLKLSLLFYNIVATFQQIHLPKQDSENEHVIPPQLFTTSWFQTRLHQSHISCSIFSVAGCEKLVSSHHLIDLSSQAGWDCVFHLNGLWRYRLHFLSRKDILFIPPGAGWSSDHLNETSETSVKHTLKRIFSMSSDYDYMPYISVHSLSQDFESGCPKLSITKNLGIFKLQNFCQAYTPKEILHELWSWVHAFLSQWVWPEKYIPLNRNAIGTAC